MNSALVHSGLNFNWRLFAKTVSKSPNWGFDRFRIYGNSWSTRIQVRRPDGTVVDTQYFNSNYQFEHDFSFDLSENVNNDEYSVYIAGVPSSAKVNQVYAYPTGYGGTTGKNAEISYWDIAQVSPQDDGTGNIGRLRFENQPLTQLDGTSNIKAGEIRVTNCQLGAENLADLIIGTDNSGITPGTLIYSGNSAAPAGRALDAYNSLKNNKAWTLTGDVPEDAPDYDPDYQSVLDYATANSIPLPNSTENDRRNQVLIDYKATGGFARDDVFFDFSGTADPQFKLICYKRLIQAQAYGGLVWDVNGVRGNGTNAYINTLFNPSTDGIKYTELNASIMAFLAYDSPNTFGNVLVGVYDGNVENYIYSTPYQGSNTYAYINGKTNGSARHDAPNKLISINRLVGNSVRTINGGYDNTSTSLDGTGLINGNVLIHSRNRLDTGTIDSYGDYGISCFALGSRKEDIHSLIEPIFIQ